MCVYGGARRDIVRYVNSIQAIFRRVSKLRTLLPEKQQVEGFLKNPFVDKIFGGIAISPVLLGLYLFSQAAMYGHVDIYQALIAAYGLIIIVFSFIRRVAVRVSLNPLYWVITAGRSYWVYVIPYFVSVGSTVLIAPLYVTRGLLVLALLILVYARLSLGRNVGYIPAQRQIVTTGAYGFVRHPIHTGQIIFFVSYLLSAFSLMSLFLVVVGIAFIIVKGLIEEDFLREDAGYRAYCEHVRFRWIPGLI